MAKLVNVVIDSQGNFTVDLTGFAGQGCSDVTKAFDSIGKTVVDRKKPEYKAIKQTLCNK